MMLKARWTARENAPDTEIPATTRVLAIASGKGGVGKSSVTVNLAAALAARGYTVGVLDADIWGFSVPRMLGIEGRLAAQDADGKGPIVPNEKPVGPGQLKVVSHRAPRRGRGHRARCGGASCSPRRSSSSSATCAWGDLDYLLIDMPPGHRRRADGPGPHCCPAPTW